MPLGEQPARRQGEGRNVIDANLDRDLDLSELETGARKKLKPAQSGWRC